MPIVFQHKHAVCVKIPDLSLVVISEKVGEILKISCIPGVGKDVITTLKINGNKILQVEAYKVLQIGTLIGYGFETYIRTEYAGAHMIEVYTNHSRLGLSCGSKSLEAIQIEEK